MKGGSFLNSSKLKTVCEPVQPGEDVKLILTRMFAAIGDGRNCVGLAANQVGYAKRIIIVCTPQFSRVFINPVIVKRYGGTFNSREGCLSFPGKLVVVTRHKQIHVTGTSPEGDPLSFKLKGLNAAVVQHEVGHLDGISCVDRAIRTLI